MTEWVYVHELAAEIAPPTDLSGDAGVVCWSIVHADIRDQISRPILDD